MMHFIVHDHVLRIALLQYPVFKKNLRKSFYVTVILILAPATATSTATDFSISMIVIATAAAATATAAAAAAAAAADRNSSASFCCCQNVAAQVTSSSWTNPSTACQRLVRVVAPDV